MLGLNSTMKPEMFEDVLVALHCTVCPGSLTRLIPDVTTPANPRLNRRGPPPLKHSTAGRSDLSKRSSNAGNVRVRGKSPKEKPSAYHSRGTRMFKAF